MCAGVQEIYIFCRSFSAEIKVRALSTIICSPRSLCAAACRHSLPSALSLHSRSLRVAAALLSMRTVLVSHSTGALLSPPPLHHPVATALHDGRSYRTVTGKSCEIHSPTCAPRAPYPHNHAGAHRGIELEGEQERQDRNASVAVLFNRRVLARGECCCTPPHICTFHQLVGAS